MAQIFISYRRSDSTTVTGRIYDRLRQEFGKDAIFKDVDNIPAGRDFRGILRVATANCGVMLVIIGPNWVNTKDAAGNRRLDDPSDFVRLEVETGLQRDDVLVIPVIVSGGTPPRATELPDNLKELAYNNALFVRDDPDFHRDMNRLIVQLARRVPKVEPKGKPKSKPTVSHEPLRRNPVIIAALIGAVAVIMGAIITVGPQLFKQDPSLQTPTTNAQVSLVNQTSTQATDTPTLPLEIGLLVATLDAQATQGQATIDIQSTSAIGTTEYVVGTQSIVNQGEMTVIWTATPTANITASIEAYRTQQVQMVAFNQTATADSWTDTPTTTFTPSTTPVLLTSTFTPIPQTVSPDQLALTPVTANANWTYVERDFDGVTMVLAPVGCFMMGSENGESDEKPVHMQCFNTPFWIDKYEVTNAQFAAFGGIATNANYGTGSNRPRETISWFEARDFCTKRDARLPTEREWEYAARGPDSLEYPWGNEWNENNAIWDSIPNRQTVDVGNRPQGASWIGAEDMVGNVFEWVSTVYGIETTDDYDFTDVGETLYAYPYTASDGREQNSNNITYIRQWRGGSWFVIDPYNFRAAYRYYGIDEFRNSFGGFRCVRA